jgi:DNA-binding NtrC family response regulator
MQYCLLVIDDEPTLRTSLKVALSRRGYRMLTAATGEEGISLWERDKPDLVLLDHWLPGIQGDEVLRLIRQKDADTPVIVMTAQGSIELAVQSMKLGAADFLIKPFELDHLERVVERGLEGIKLKKELEWLRGQYQQRFQTAEIVAVSEKMKSIMDIAAKVARGADTTVLIQGETGTGKELLAEHIHFLSPRFASPLVAVNCGAIPRELFESELFGYERGAFTGALEKGKKGVFETARGGTVFLDEVADLPPETQVKFLRFLEQREFFKVGGVEKINADVRIIAASNRPLASWVAQGRFREDLYFRLNVVGLTIPPLRERPADILPLFKFFLQRFNEQFRKNFHRITPEAQEILLGYSWPGNVREMRNIAERLVLLEYGECVLPDHLSPLSWEESPEDRPGSAMERENLNLESMEKSYLEEALRRTRGNQVRAACLLGITRSALLYRLNKYGLQQPKA